MLLNQTASFSLTQTHWTVKTKQILYLLKTAYSLSCCCIWWLFLNCYLLLCSSLHLLIAIYSINLQLEKSICCNIAFIQSVVLYCILYCYCCFSCILSLFTLCIVLLCLHLSNLALFLYFVLHCASEGTLFHSVLRLKWQPPTWLESLIHFVSQSLADKGNKNYKY